MAKARNFPKRLDTCWKYCLQMWRDIVVALDLTGQTKCTSDIKFNWLVTNGFDDCAIEEACFFCQWAVEHGSGIVEASIEGGCPDCPGVKVDPEFACQLYGRYWSENPFEFAAYLERLNNKRIKMKKGRK